MNIDNEGWGEQVILAKDEAYIEIIKEFTEILKNVPDKYKNQIKNI